MHCRIRVFAECKPQQIWALEEKAEGLSQHAVNARKAADFDPRRHNYTSMIPAQYEDY